MQHSRLDSTTFNNLCMFTKLLYSVVLFCFHGWVYLMLTCFVSFFVVLAIGATSQLLINRIRRAEVTLNSKHNQPKEQEAPSVDTSEESLFRKFLLNGNMLCTFPTYSQLICIGVFCFLFFYVCGPSGKSVLMLYYAHLWTDQCPSEYGWDEDIPFIKCLFGFGGDWGRAYTGTTNAIAANGVKAEKVLQRSYLPNIGFGFQFRSFFRMLPSFRLVREYFDSELVRTIELKDADKRNYLFLYHPHGIMIAGANTTLVTDCAGFPQLFPGVHRSTCALNGCFLVPFYRDLMLAVGFISVNRSTIVKHLTSTQPFRRSVVLMPGGAAEALHAHPGYFRVYLQRRKGFIRVALQTGCSMVPCLGFGENEIFQTLYAHVRNNETGGKDETEKATETTQRFKQMFFTMQSSLTKLFTFSVPILTHVMPLRKKLTVVVGAPIHCDEDCCGLGMAPDEDLVDKYHRLYCKRLQELYDKHKEKYGVPGVELEIT